MDIPRNNIIPSMIFIVSLLVVQVRAHMIMANPTPYSYQTIDNSPLTSSNYPCKVTSDPDTFYSQSGIDNTYAAGSVQTLSFKGSAVHGGGSCQLAITNDMQPSEDTDWRVILSIESGCPTTDGTSASTYNWTVPEDLAAGQYSFAWTWISKLAGQPEYYMNCAPITVTSSSSKRSSEQLTSRASDYPELFVANLDSINSCKTSPGTDVVYPDPGPNVEKLLTGATPSFASISQAGCVPKSQSQDSKSLPTATAGGSGSSSDGSSDAAGSSGSVTTSAAASSSESTSTAGFGGIFATTTATQDASTATTLVTTTSAAATAEASSTASSDLSVYVSPVVQSSFSEKSTSSSAATSSSSSSSGGFATSAATSTVETKTSATSSASATTTLASTTSSSSSSSSSSAAASATATGSGNSTSSSGSATTQSGTCSDEGMFNCVGDQYQQCASGAWTEMRSLPSGTTCQQGESTTLWARGVGGVKSRTNVNLLRRVRRDGRWGGI